MGYAQMGRGGGGGGRLGEIQVPTGPCGIGKRHERRLGAGRHRDQYDVTYYSSYLILFQRYYS